MLLTRFCHDKHIQLKFYEGYNSFFFIGKKLVDQELIDSFPFFFLSNNMYGMSNL